MVFPEYLFSRLILVFPEIKMGLDMSFDKETKQLWITRDTTDTGDVRVTLPGGLQYNQVVFPPASYENYRKLFQQYMQLKIVYTGFVESGVLQQNDYDKFKVLLSSQIPINFYKNILRYSTGNGSYSPTGTLQTFEYEGLNGNIQVTPFQLALDFNRILFYPQLMTVNSKQIKLPETIDKSTLSSLKNIGWYEYFNFNNISFSSSNTQDIITQYEEKVTNGNLRTFDVFNFMPDLTDNQDYASQYYEKFNKNIQKLPSIKDLAKKKLSYTQMCFYYSNVVDWSMPVNDSEDEVQQNWYNATACLTLGYVNMMILFNYGIVKQLLTKVITEDQFDSLVEQMKFKFQNIGGKISDKSDNSGNSDNEEEQPAVVKNEYYQTFVVTQSDSPSQFMFPVENQLSPNVKIYYKTNINSDWTETTGKSSEIDSDTRYIILKIESSKGNFTATNDQEHQIKISNNTDQISIIGHSDIQILPNQNIKGMHIEVSPNYSLNTSKANRIKIATTQFAEPYIQSIYINGTQLEVENSSLEINTSEYTNEKIIINVQYKDGIEEEIRELQDQSIGPDYTYYTYRYNLKSNNGSVLFYIQGYRDTISAVSGETITENGFITYTSTPKSFTINDQAVELDDQEQDEQQ